MTTLLEFLYKNRKDTGVTIAIAVEAAKKLLAGELTLDKNEYDQDPIIWGDGWYAIYSNTDLEGEDLWWVSPKKYFEEYGICPDGWEWEIPEGMTTDELDDFIDLYGYEPNAPEGFSYCMESCLICDKDWDVNKQKDVLKQGGLL